MIDRRHVEFVCPSAIEPRALAVPFSGEQLRGRELVGDLAQGDGAALIELPAGWRSRSAAVPYELIVLGGELDAGGTLLERHGHVSVAAGEGPTLLARSPSLAFVDAGRDVDRSHVTPMGEDGWERTPLEGLTMRPTRGTLGEPCGFFLRVPPQWSMQMTEWHECAEAALMLEGDLWHLRANDGRGGTMREHCYFWRPPLRLHSPMGSDGGALMWIYVDGPLVNHFVEVEGEPPWQRELAGEPGS